MSFPDIAPSDEANVVFGSESDLGFPQITLEACGYRPQGTAWNYRGVNSPFWRFYWNAKPGSYVKAHDAKYRLTPEKVLLIPENLRFDTHGGGGGIPHLWLHFSVQPHLGNHNGLPIHLPLDPVIRPALEALRECWSRPASRQDRYHRAFSLLHAALASCGGLRRPVRSEPLTRVLNHIQEHRGEQLDNAILARLAGRSIEGFVRWFGGEMQTTPQTYVTEFRLRQAARELQQTEDSLERIAERNGFANRHYFSRVFARWQGLPPASYRARSRTMPD